MTFVVALIFIVTYSKSKKIKMPENFESIEHIFDEKYTTISNYTNGSKVENQYNYIDFAQIIETDEFFYIILKNGMFTPLDKNSMDNKDEFIKFMKNKNITTQEHKNDNK